MTDTIEQPKTLKEAIERHKLTIQSVFIPFSASRNKSEKHPTLNWSVTLLRDGKAIANTLYSAGSAHCPSYKRGDNRWIRDQMVKHECEHGFRAFSTYGDHIGSSRHAITPKIEDVVYSLALDSDVIDYRSYEDWAENFGYDADSRKGEKIYRECLEIALALRAGLGEAALADLRSAAEDY